MLLSYTQASGRSTVQPQLGTRSFTAAVASTCASVSEPCYPVINGSGATAGSISSVVSASATLSAALSTRRKRRAARTPQRCAESVAADVKLSPLMELELNDPSKPGSAMFTRTLTCKNMSGEDIFVLEADADAGGGSWRKLMFAPWSEQSMALLDSDGAQRPEALCFPYVKSMAATGIATSRILKANRQSDEQLRVLIIGVGGGSLPLWYQAAGANVDAVELDQAVVDIATKEMGFPATAVRDSVSSAACVADAAANASHPGCGALRVYCCDGAEFLVEAASKSLHYDIVMLDAFDAQSNFPKAFRSDEFTEALGKVCQNGCMIANFPHDRCGPRINAWLAGFGPDANACTVTVDGGDNVVATFMHTEAPELSALESAARAAADDGLFRFDPVRRVSREHRVWKPE